VKAGLCQRPEEWPWSGGLLHPDSTRVSRGRLGLRACD
jgi:hypothetical protein